MQLPVELRLIICHLLGPADRKSLSYTCRAMLAFINTTAPFRTLKLTRGGLSELILLRRYSHVLAFTNEIHWKSGQERACQSSASASTVVGQSFRILLSALQTSSSLRLFEIYRLNVSSSHQRIILSIPTLRELILNQSTFIRSTVRMPSSSITTLRFVPGASPSSPPTTHILKLLSESLEILDVGDSPRSVQSTLVTRRFPRLVSLRGGSVDLSTLVVFRSITKLYIKTRIIHQLLNFPPDILPRLRDLSSPWWVAEQLAPGRPIRVFSDTEREAVSLYDLDVKLLQLGRSTHNIEELQVFTYVSTLKIFVVLGNRLPRLERLKLWAPTETIMTPTAIGKGADRNSLKACLLALRDIDIRFQRRTKKQYPSQQISRPFCHWMLYMTAKACPVLQVSIFAALDSMKLDIEERDISPAWKFNACRTSKGEWEERREKLLTASEEEGTLKHSLRKHYLKDHLKDFLLRCK